MNKMIKAAASVANDQSGAATVEYGLITLVVVGAVAGAGSLFKTQITSLFTDVGATLTAAQTEAKG